jgi:hypothetical protein
MNLESAGKTIDFVKAVMMFSGKDNRVPPGQSHEMVPEPWASEESAAYSRRLLKISQADIARRS